MPKTQTPPEGKVRNPLTKKWIKVDGPVAAKLLKQHKNKEITLSPTFVKVLQGEKVKPLNAMFKELPTDLQACIKQKTFDFEEDVQANIAFVKKMAKCTPKFAKMSLPDVYIRTVEKIAGGFDTIKISPKDTYSTVTKRCSKDVSGKLKKIADDLDTTAFDVYFDGGKRTRSSFPINVHSFSQLLFILNVLNFGEDSILDKNVYRAVLEELADKLGTKKETFKAVNDTVKFETSPITEMWERGLSLKQHLINKKARVFIDLRKPENMAKLRDFVVAHIGVPTDLRRVLKFAADFKLYLGPV